MYSFRENAVYVFLVFLASIAILSCGQKEGKGRAKEFLAAGMYQEALSVIELHLQSDPADGEAHYLLAKALLGIGDENSAKEEFQRSSLLSSNLSQEVPAAYFDVGSVYLSKDGPRHVEYGYSLLRVAVEQKPSLSQDVSASLRKRGLMMVDGRPELAEQLLTEAIRLNAELAKDEDVQIVLANIPTNLNIRRNRLEAFLATFPESAYSSQAYLDIGQCYYALKENENAKIRLQYVCDHFPESGQAQEAQRLLETIMKQEADLLQIETERREAESKAEMMRAEAERKAEIENARIEAEAEKTRLQAELKRKEQADKEMLEARKQELALRSSGHSEFNGGSTDGWTAYGTTIANPGYGGKSGGASDGCLIVTKDKPGVTGYFIAPAAFHGDWRGASELHVDLKSSGGGYFTSGYGMQGDIALYNGKKCAWRILPKRPSSSWDRFSIPLSDDGMWNFKGGATNLKDVTANVTDFRIRAEYGTSKDDCALDNVKLIWPD